MNKGIYCLNKESNVDFVSCNEGDLTDLKGFFSQSGSLYLILVDDVGTNCFCNVGRGWWRVGGTFFNEAW